MNNGVCIQAHAQAMAWCRGATVTYPGFNRIYIAYDILARLDGREHGFDEAVDIHRNKGGVDALAHEYAILYCRVFGPLINSFVVPFD